MNLFETFEELNKLSEETNSISKGKAMPSCPYCDSDDIKFIDTKEVSNPYDIDNFYGTEHTTTDSYKCNNCNCKFVELKRTISYRGIDVVEDGTDVDYYYSREVWDDFDGGELPDEFPIQLYMLDGERNWSKDFTTYGDFKNKVSKFIKSCKDENRNKLAISVSDIRNDLDFIVSLNPIEEMLDDPDYDYNIDGPLLAGNNGAAVIRIMNAWADRWGKWANYDQDKHENINKKYR